jgi:NAD(P)H-flavin reductase
MSETLTPMPALLEAVWPMVEDNHVFTFLPEQALEVHPGQFVEISLPGVGSFPVSTCQPVENNRIVSCIRRAGRVTEALYRLQPGDGVGLRGAFGNGFDLQSFAARDLLLIAGGLGMAPLRALLLALLAETQSERRIILLYGSREPKTLLFRDELIELSRMKKIDLSFSVDFAVGFNSFCEETVCRLGLVNELLHDLEFAPANTVAAVCGPPALYRCVLGELAALGIAAERIFATLERRMRCGIGECCHCVTAGRYICREGPVFSLSELRSMPGAI